MNKTLYFLNFLFTDRTLRLDRIAQGFYFTGNTIDDVKKAREENLEADIDMRNHFTQI